MNRQRKVVITVTYNDLGVIVDTKAEELDSSAQPNVQDSVKDVDCISRQMAIDAINTWDKFGVDERGRLVRWHEGLELYVHLRDVLTAIVNLPSAQPEKRTDKRTETHACDCISRQAAIDAIDKRRDTFIERDDELDISAVYAYSDCKAVLKFLPSTQPEHGEWKPAERKNIFGEVMDGFRCNRCNKCSLVKHNLFPDCGADMRGEVETP